MGCVSQSIFGFTSYLCIDKWYYEDYESFMSDMGATVEIVGGWTPGEEEEDSAFKLGATLASAAVLAALF